MKTYMIIAKVNGIDYLTKVIANSAGGAEHAILDQSYCGRHTYGVTACTAFDVESMKTDCFIFSALEATPIDLERLMQIIEERNVEIRELDEAERDIERIEKQMEALKKDLADAKARLAK